MPRSPPIPELWSVAQSRRRCSAPAAEMPPSPAHGASRTGASSSRRCGFATLRVRGGALVALSRVDAGAGATPAEARRAALAPATHGLHHPVVIADTPAGSAGGGWVEPDLARGLLELARINLAYHPAPAPAA